MHGDIYILRLEDIAKTNHIYYFQQHPKSTCRSDVEKEELKLRLSKVTMVLERNSLGKLTIPVFVFI